MKRHEGILAAAALALLASCHPAPRPLTAAERAAVADTIRGLVADILATFEHPDYERIFDAYERGNDSAFAENGMIFPTFDSMIVAAKNMETGYVVRAWMGPNHVTVLDRDVAVLTTIIIGERTSPAGVKTGKVQAWTGVFHRTPVGWKIAASHESYPHECPACPAAPPAARRRP
jgi:hypothetical protein